MMVLKTLLNTETQSVQTRGKLVRKHVTQFAREDDHIVCMFLVSLSGQRVSVAVRHTAIPKAEDREEDLKSTLFIELIGDHRRDLKTIVDTMFQAVIIGSFDDAVGHTRELHTGEHTCLKPYTHLTIEQGLHSVAHIRCYLECALVYTQVG